MPLTPTVDLNDLQDGWRSLTGHLTADQVRRLATMERHPAYGSRPGLLVLEAVEMMAPGAVGEYVAARAALTGQATTRKVSNEESAGSGSAIPASSPDRR